MRTGVYRLLSAFARHGAKSSVMTNAIIAERAPEAVKAVAQAGHEISPFLCNGRSIPGPSLSDEEERQSVARSSSSGPQARNSGLAEPARYIKDDDKAPGEGGLSLVRRCVQNTDLPYVQSFDGNKIVAIPLSYDVNDMPSHEIWQFPSLDAGGVQEVVEIARRAMTSCGSSM